MSAPPRPPLRTPIPAEQPTVDAAPTDPVELMKWWMNLYPALVSASPSGSAHAYAARYSSAPSSLDRLASLPGPSQVPVSVAVEWEPIAFAAMAPLRDAARSGHDAATFRPTGNASADASPAPAFAFPPSPGAST